MATTSHDHSTAETQAKRAGEPELPASPPPTPSVFGDRAAGPRLTNGRPPLLNGASTATTQVERDDVSLGNGDRTSSPENLHPPRAAVNGFHGPDHEHGDAERRRTHPIPPLRPREHDAGGPQSRSRAHIRSYTDDEKAKRFPRISVQVELMRSSYDCIVIGSGYGGAIAASRMARAGQSVCVLERGREKWPGEYPVGTAESLEELHVSGDFAPGWTSGKGVDGGDPTGMFHLIFGKGQNAVVCNGKQQQQRGAGAG